MCIPAAWRCRRKKAQPEAYHTSYITRQAPIIEYAHHLSTGSFHSDTIIVRLSDIAPRVVALQHGAAGVDLQSTRVGAVKMKIMVVVVVVALRAVIESKLLTRRCAAGTFECTNGNIMKSVATSLCKHRQHCAK